MAIGDAAALGAAISRHAGDLDAALAAYDAERVPTTTQEVGRSAAALLLRWCSMLGGTDARCHALALPATCSACILPCMPCCTAALLHCWHCALPLMHGWSHQLTAALVQVLFSRWLGQLKQGMLHSRGGSANSTAWWQDSAILEQVPQKCMRSFDADKHQLR